MTIDDIISMLRDLAGAANVVGCITYRMRDAILYVYPNKQYYGVEVL